MHMHIYSFGFQRTLLNYTAVNTSSSHMIQSCLRVQGRESVLDVGWLVGWLVNNVIMCRSVSVCPAPETASHLRYHGQHIGG